MVDGPYRFVECPVHGKRVAVGPSNRVMGRCDSCALEAAMGIASIRHGYEVDTPYELSNDPAMPSDTTLEAAQAARERGA